MSPGLIVNGGHENQDNLSNGVNSHTGRKLAPWDEVHFDPHLKPKSYQIKGTNPDSKILFVDVNIFDSTGRDPYRGDVYIEGEKIKHVGTVPHVDSLRNDSQVRVIEGRGRTLMSGLGDAHTHFTWNEGDLGALAGLGVEEHTLFTARAAQTYLDSGYTMCFGAASAKDRLDVVIRDAINEGQIPGPRYLANCKEMARRDGELVPGITAFADGPLEMREVIQKHVEIGCDQIKLSMSGEEICETRSAEDCYFTDEEAAACVDEAHRYGIRLCAHARARDSVKMCVKHGIDIIYHASWTDDEGMEMLEKNKHRHMVAPGINWLYATLYEAGAFGYSFEKAEQVGYKREFEQAKKVLSTMHKKGITVLPGGDYGFAWTPHGTYARDLEHFVKLLDFTPMESLLAATAGVAKLFMREDELGKILPGFYADCILVDGNPLEDIAVLQDHSKLNVIMINGRIHKASYKEFSKTAPLSGGDKGLIKLSNGKSLHVETYGSDGSEPVLFIHGLGGNTTFYHPLLSSLKLKDSQTHRSILFDLEGHGLSPTSAESVTSIPSYADDVYSLLRSLSVTRPTTVVAHSMGCLVALAFTQSHPELVKSLVLLGPPPSPLPAAAAGAQRTRAATVRAGSMSAVADAVTAAGTSPSAVRASLLSTDPEGYAKTCTALAETEHHTVELESLPGVDVLMVTGTDDKVATVDNVRKMEEALGRRPKGHGSSVTVTVLDRVGHWSVFEDLSGVSGAVGKFI